MTLHVQMCSRVLDYIVDLPLCHSVAASCVYISVHSWL